MVNVKKRKGRVVIDSDSEDSASDDNLDQELLSLAKRKRVDSGEQEEPVSKPAASTDSETSDSDDEWTVGGTKGKKKVKPGKGSEKKSATKKKVNKASGSSDGGSSGDSSAPEEGEVSDSEINSSSSDSDTSEDDEFEDGYDDDLMGDAEDRARLEQMTEKEREQELFNRIEKREVLKRRFEIKQKLKTAKKKEKEEKKKKQEEEQEKKKQSQVQDAQVSKNAAGSSMFSPPSGKKPAEEKSRHTLLSASKAPSSRPAGSAAPFRPSVLSTRRINVRFSEATRDNEFKGSLLKTPARMSLCLVSSTPQAAAGAGPHTGRPSTFSAQKTPRTFVFNGNTSLTPGTQKKATFDLKASLARPLTYKPHAGKLKPFAEVKENAAANKSLNSHQESYKQHKVQTREDRRTQQAQGRKQKKESMLGARRGLAMM
ncbi:RNA polymerase-associated protein RTF1 homolog isoform X2 [Oryzias latipes]|uniref:RNA polymerase-associated protein RTF1 homolog isoform X2 n=1 Tax=Oryzias latipes TaxID=8090 RepID=UPI0009DADB74|nr:RNA polymerase-associated protein RTF1 homolog isoform X2 [Oryzias latipes]